MQKKPLKIIGLTGSIASGKSTVADIIKTHGIAVLDADEAAKKLAEIGGDAHEDIATNFPEALTESPAESPAESPPESPPESSSGNRQIDRKKLAELVFADKEKLLVLENILHPKIKTMRARFYEAAQLRGDKVVFIMVPLLFEKNIDAECDATWVVVCTPDLQRQRALTRAGMDDALLAKILASQMPDDEKIKRCDVVIDNNGNLEELKIKIAAELKNLKT